MPLQATNELLLMLMCKHFSSLEQVDDDPQSDQPYESILAQVRNERGEIWHHSSEEWQGLAEKDVGYDPEGDQQQEYFCNLTKPFLHFFQIMHLRLSY